MLNYDIKTVQDNLYYIRKIIGLTGTELGKYLGVSRQQIYNIEHHLTKMSKTQCLALLYILQEYIFPNIPESDKNNIIKMLTVHVVNEKLTFKFKEES